MQADIVAGNMETYAAACLRTVIAGRLIEAFEDVGLVIVGNALAGVGYGDDHAVGFRTEQQRYTAACRCEFQGVREEVVYHLVDLLAIVVHQKAVSIVLETEANVTLFGIIAK